MRNFVDNLSIETLYPIALLGEEGIGTAYEYFVKLNLIVGFFKTIKPPKKILVGGLPEVFGLSQDFIILAQKYGASITIADERRHSINKFDNVLKYFKDKVVIDVICVDKISELKLKKDEDKYDLFLSCEVLQRLPSEERSRYFNQIRELANTSAIFVPNEGNSSHSRYSGLRAVSLEDLSNYCHGNMYKILKDGHIDIPPFPPGLKRSSEARNKAMNSNIERFLMKMLETWYPIENLFPEPIKRRFSHIAYVIFNTNESRRSQTIQTY